MKYALRFAAMLLCLFFATCVIAEEIELRDKLDKMPRPWRAKVHRLTSAEYEATLKYWGEKFPGKLAVDVVGRTLENAPIHLLTATDTSVDDTDKQICLVTSLHGGPERSGTTTILHLIEWLMGDSPEAAETLRRQVVLLMPIVNPYAYFQTDRFGNSQGIDPYTGGGAQNWDLATLTYKARDKSPEVSVFLDVVDRCQPEVHIDLHGTGLQEYPVDRLGDRSRYQGQTMFEVSGSAYSNYALRPWDWRITEAMIQRGMEAGYPSDRFEADAQRAFWGPAMQPITDWHWLGRPNFYTSQYAYAKYHTLLAALEIGWEESGVARTRGLLELGNGGWQDEIVAEYPVNRLKSFIGHYVTAWGTHARERRQSRVELWKKQVAFTQAVLYPQTDGRDTYIVAVTPESAASLDEDLVTFANNLREYPSVQTSHVATFIDAGPEIKLAIRKGARTSSAPQPMIQHGLGLRLRLPYQEPNIVDVRLNGHELAKDACDGYQSWLGNGFTQVQINIPPEKTRETAIYVVTCAYTPDTQRHYGWKPPPEVTRQLNATEN